MKLINKDADYAIKALVEIAGRGGQVAHVARADRTARAAPALST